MIQIKSFLLVFSLFALVITDDECSDEIILQEACSKFKGAADGQSCYYDGSSCISVYSKCTDYTGSDQTTCEGIDLHDDRYKCILNTDNRCVQYTNKCSDGNNKGKAICEAYSSEENNNHCYYNEQNSQCETHFNNCGDAPQAQCDANVPSDSKYICYYEDSQCKSRKRKCDEYLNSDDCWDLDPDADGMKCLFESNDCQPGYKYCEDYTATTIDQGTCKTIQPYIKDSNEIDYSHKCVKEGNQCIKKQKECSDWKTGESSLYCSMITFDTNEYKKCAYSYSNCEESYTDCQGYEGTNENTCKNIKPDYSYYKCVIENSKCIRTSRMCSSDYDATIDQTYCYYLSPTNSSYQCLYDSSSSKCIELPKTCEEYKGSSKDECELIQIYNNGTQDYQHKCAYENNQCVTKQKQCSEITDSTACNNLVLSETKKCLYNNTKCIEFYKQCEDYEGTDRLMCEKIKPYKSMYEVDEEYECVFVKDKNCTKMKKEEPEYCIYNGTNPEICAMYTPSDPSTKVCVISNSKCVERYKYCSEYKGLVSSECTAIKPYDPETNKIDPYSKCVFTNNKCVKQTKKCSDYNGYDPNECAKYDTYDKDKECSLKGSNCREFYKKCEYYNGTSIYQSTCESIVLRDYTKKCEYTAASGGQPAKCETKYKTCSEYDRSSYIRNYCEGYSLNNYLKKCKYGYSNSYSQICYEYNNSCSDIKFENENEATEEKCNALNTTSSKCTLKGDKTGCRLISQSTIEEETVAPEIMKEVEKIKEQERNSKNNNQCSAEN